MSQPRSSSSWSTDFGLHTFGDDGEAELVAELDHRRDDGAVLGARLHCDDEGAVDLQLAHGEVTEEAERRVALTEVVDAHVHATARERAQQSARRARGR